MKTRMRLWFARIRYCFSDYGPFCWVHGTYLHHGQCVHCHLAEERTRISGLYALHPEKEKWS